MKKLFFLGTLILSLMGGPWGCGKMMSPISPTAQNAPAQSPTATGTPVYSSQWTMADSQPLSNPLGIAVDGSNNVYVTDADLDEVLKYDANGNLLSHWGNVGQTTLDQPSGIAVKNGNVYVADSANSRVVEYDSNGTVLGIIQPVNGEYYTFVYPTGISFDAAGNLYVSDNSDAVYQFDNSSHLTAQWTANGSLNFPVVSLEDASGNVYVANYNSNNIVKFNPQLGTVSTWGQSGTQTGRFNGPSDVKLDPNGNVAVVDTDNNRIQVFSTAGTFLTQWGQDTNSANSLNSPNSLAYDSNGNVFVVDSGNSRVVKYTVAAH